MYAGEVVEEGPVAEIFRNPRHPYTQGLMQAIPRLGERAERLAVIPGMVPSATNWPIGCRFHARCPYGFDVCVNEHPELFVINEQHTSRCWLEQYPERRAEIDRLGGYATVRDGGEEPPAEAYHRAAAALEGLPAPELEQPVQPPPDIKGSDA
jgi:peptide/nickel transport system ATP-binding protein